MAGTPANALLWNEADVFVAPLGTSLPANSETAFSGSWDLVGILDGTAGFEESREEETSDKYGWGGILLRTTRKNFKLQKKFTALEQNDTTFDLRWPGSTATALEVPRPVRQLVAFETRDTTIGITHRVISAYQCEIDLDGSVTETEEEIANLPFIATIFPSAVGVLWTAQDTPGS